MAQGPNVVALNPTPSPLATSVWPIPGDAPDLETIIKDQAQTMADQAALIGAYQADLTNAQHPAPGAAATATGTASGTPANNLAVSILTGTIVQGATVTGAGIPAAPPATTILGQINGTVGGVGTYLTSQATTCSSSALTFTPPPPASGWPTPSDAPTLTAIQQDQSAILKTQTALIQQYQDLLNDSVTTPPPTGP
jgi:hypothetical protein